MKYLKKYMLWNKSVIILILILIYLKFLLFLDISKSSVTTPENGLHSREKKRRIDGKVRIYVLVIYY